MALAAFSPDGERLLLAGSDNAARLWDASSGKPIGEAMRHKGAVLGVAFDADGKRAVTASADGTARLWDGGNGAPIAITLRHEKAVASAVFSPDGQQLLTAGADGLLRLWRAGDGSPAADPVKHPAALRAALFAAGGKALVSAADDGLVRAWDAASLQPLGEPIKAGKQAVLAESGGKLLATGSAAGVVRFWKGNASGPAADDLEIGALPNALALDAGLRHLLVACDDGLARLWDLSTRELRLALKHPAAVLSAAFDAKAARIVTVAADQAARVWDLETGKLIGPTVMLADPATDSGGHSGTVPQIVSTGVERVVTVNGITGLFRPISHAAGEPLSEDERANLLALIDQLKRDNATLLGQSQKLAADLAALRAPAAAPDDFASGVQHSVDELQQRLSTMSNPISNFAVRGLKLETSVFVQITALGSIEYRFVQPGDKVDASALSRLTLDLVPVPKANLANVWTPNLFQPELGVSALPELLPAQSQSLEGAGVFSIGEFLQVATRARTQAYLEALLGADRQRLAAWAQQALLLTLRGVDGAMAQLLIEAGFTDFDALAGGVPDALVAALDAARARRPELQGGAVDTALAEQWIRAARQYLGLAEA